MNADELLKHKIANVPGNRELILSAANRSGKTAALGRVTAQAMGGVGNPERKPVQVPALEQGQAHKHRSQKRVLICVEIISFRNRAVDEDNLIAGAKPIRDCIARSLGVDDADRRIKWTYRQQHTDGAPGTLIKIDRLK